MNECIFCNKPVDDYIAEYCCDGYMCGCGGGPIEPPMHIECYTKWRQSRKDND